MVVVVVVAWWHCCDFSGMNDAIMLSLSSMWWCNGVVVQWCGGDTASSLSLFQWHRWGHCAIAIIDVVVQWWW